ncbi:MAG: hypothetical protein JWN70_3957 [Planctomycetaceae bacterium]|nr:hypothetical protein [Planctomycetaceae bacterium]
MSHLTLKRLAILGALSLGGMTQTASAQWMPFGGAFRGGCSTCEMPQIPATVCGPTCGVACAPPPVVCAPPPPRYVMQPFTETRRIEQVVQRPVCETRQVPVQEVAYRQEIETRTAQVPTVSYQTVCETQTRQRDCGRWVTSYRCRPQVAPCAYDSRPGLLGAMNRSFYSARMAMTPAVVAERTYVPNVITEQIPVTRQVAIPGVRQVTYQVPRTVAFTTQRMVSVQSTRYVAERIPQQIQVTTMRPVLVDGTTGLAINPGAPGIGTAVLPGYPTYGTAYGYPYGSPYGTAAVPDPNFGPTRTAARPDAATPPTPIPPRGATGPRNAPPMDGGGSPAAAPVPVVPTPPAAHVVPPRDPDETDEAVEEVAQASRPVQHTAGYRPAPQVETVSSLPSIVRVSQWSGFRNAAPRTAESPVVASSKK